VNRGLAILGDTLFMGTIDAFLLALDAPDTAAQHPGAWRPTSLTAQPPSAADIAGRWRVRQTEFVADGFADSSAILTF
jgi:hypothetical protein